jgi:hypothetical protein
MSENVADVEATRKSLTSFRCLEGQNVTGWSPVSRIDDSNADEIDGEWNEFVNEGFGSVANHFAGSLLSFLLRPGFNFIAFKVACKTNQSDQTCSTAVLVKYIRRKHQ